jgi:CubicO group peptidase (beta-lactamase class C family)
MLVPADYLFSNAEDMDHYLMAHLNGGVVDAASVLSSRGIDELHRTSALSGGYGYALGWTTDSQCPSITTESESGRLLYLHLPGPFSSGLRSPACRCPLPMPGCRRCLTAFWPSALEVLPAALLSQDW